MNEKETFQYMQTKKTKKMQKAKIYLIENMNVS